MKYIFQSFHILYAEWIFFAVCSLWDMIDVSYGCSRLTDDLVVAVLVRRTLSLGSLLLSLWWFLKISHSSREDEEYLWKIALRPKLFPSHYTYTSTHVPSPSVAAPTLPQLMADPTPALTGHHQQHRTMSRNDVFVLEGWHPCSRRIIPSF